METPIQKSRSLPDDARERMTDVEKNKIANSSNAATFANDVGAAITLTAAAKAAVAIKKWRIENWKRAGGPPAGSFMGHYFTATNTCFRFSCLKTSRLWSSLVNVSG